MVETPRLEAMQSFV